MMNKEISLLYVWDAYCGWCYGFSKSIRTLHERHPELEMKVLSGGLFTGDRSQPIMAFPHIPEANKRISQLTGVEYGEGYHKLLEEGTFVMDSEAAAIGFAALRSLAPERAVYLASAMQYAFYNDGKSLSDPETYRVIAIANNLDPEIVVDRLSDENTAAEALADFTRARQLNVASYPTLLVQIGDEYAVVGGGAMSAEKLEARLKAILAN